jgi:hypothetical protein
MPLQSYKDKHVSHTVGGIGKTKGKEEKIFDFDCG